MRKSARRKLGASLGLLAIIAVTLADVPLITMTRRHFDATGGTAYDIQPHWPLVISSLAFLAGVVLLLFPGHDHVV
jgi:hypothetical protein